MKTINTLGKYQARFGYGDVSGKVAVTRAGQINIQWDYSAQVDTDYHKVLRDVDLAYPLSGLEMDHTLDDAESLCRAIVEAVSEAAAAGVAFGANARAMDIILSEPNEYAWPKLTAMRAELAAEIASGTDYADIYEVTGPGLKIGSRVQAGEGEDHDTGRIDDIDAVKGVATVSWDSLVVAPCPVELLRPV